LEKEDFVKHFFNKVWRSLKRFFFREWGNSTDRSEGSINLVSFLDQGRIKTMKIKKNARSALGVSLYW